MEPVCPNQQFPENQVIAFLAQQLLVTPETFSPRRIPPNRTGDRMMRTRSCRFWLTVVATSASALLAACTGVVGDPGTSGGGSGVNINNPPVNVPGAKACTAPASSSNFHRLNSKQYQESVSQVLGMTLPLQQDLPADASLFGFDNDADTSLTAALTQNYLDAAKKAVTTALADPTARAKLVSCDLKTGASCVRAILSTWLPKVFRRPVLSSELDQYQSYMTICSSSPEAGLSCAMQ